MKKIISNFLLFSFLFRDHTNSASASNITFITSEPPISPFAPTSIMVPLISLRRQCFILALAAVAAIFCCHLGHAQTNPMQLAGSALQCFSNKLIYKGCNKEYQLDEGGDLEVPCEATNEYCNGPCLSETKSLLNCINRMASNFIFNNRLTPQLVGNALDTGCNSYVNQRVAGTFIVGDDYNRPSRLCGLNLSSSSPSPSRFQFYAMVVILVFCSLLVTHL